VIQSSNLQAGIPRLTAAIRALQPQRAEHYAALADALRVSGQCGQAIRLYEDALRRNPGDTLIVQKMVLCLSSTGEHVKAEQALRSAIEKTPDDPKLWDQLGLELAQQGRGQDAISAFEKATTLDPDLLEAWNNLGEVWLQNRDPGRAETALRNGLLVQPNAASTNLNLANILAGTNRFEEAKFHFDAAVRAKPDDSFIHFRYGLALTRARQFPEARAQLQKSLDLLLRAGLPAEAIPYLRTAAASSEPQIRDQAQRVLNQIVLPSK
jgi:tetratricopeptide (TPR) repeat protein